MNGSGNAGSGDIITPPVDEDYIKAYIKNLTERLIKFKLDTGDPKADVTQAPTWLIDAWANPTCWEALLYYNIEQNKWPWGNNQDEKDYADFALWVQSIGRQHWKDCFPPDLYKPGRTKGKV